MHAKLIFILAAALLPSLTLAAEIYRWVDEQGRTHIADFVPDRYRGSAVAIDSSQFELSANDAARASLRASREREQEANAVAAARRARTDAKGAMSLPNATPADDVPGGAECARMWRIYHDSQECFAPYVLANGALRDEAYAHCTNITDPSSSCGTAK